MPDRPVVIDKGPTGFGADGQATARALWNNLEGN